MKKTILIVAASVLSLATFAQSKKNDVKSGYGKNIVRFNPLNVFEFGGVGVGLGYERILTDDGKFGVKIPFHLGLRSETDWSGSFANRNVTNYSLMINPGIKFYPMGQRKVTYGLGFSVFGVTGSDNYYNNNGTILRYETGNHFHLGMMVDNSLQFNLTPKFNIGMELGLGPSYFNQYNNDNFRNSDGIQMMASFNFHIGYRF